MHKEHFLSIHELDFCFVAMPMFRNGNFLSLGRNGMKIWVKTKRAIVRGELTDVRQVGSW